MASELGVQTIQHTNGTDAMTIDSSGRVNMPNTVEIDQWRLINDFTTNDATITPFERVDDPSFSKAGTGMTHSSGVFTFPSTGLYKVTSLLDIDCGNDAVVAVEIEVSSNSGSSYDRVSYASHGGAAADGDRNGASAQVNLVNVTDASAFRFRLVSNSLAGNAKIKGDTTNNRTSVLFERITDAQ